MAQVITPEIRKAVLQEQAEKECGSFGHSYEHLHDHRYEPIQLFCTRCGRSWKVGPVDADA